jgi:hypothetical protein
LLRIWYIVIGTVLLLTGFVNNAKAQDDLLRKAQGRFSGLGGGGGTGDSIAHRTGLEDSITIRFRFLDTSRVQGFDSVLYDFTKRFPVPWYHITLGNFGNASRSLLFSPMLKPGWDHGFHAYDIYNLTVSDARFYNTTRPYAELNYMLGSRSEQFIRLMHTQNIKPNWNVAFEYRLMNSPGFFQNQNTNHNNYRLTSWYQSKNKRYQNFIVVVGNKLQSGDNGGIRTDQNYLDTLDGAYDERSNIPTQLGPDNPGSRNFFSTNIITGTFYTNATYLLRQQYDLGQKDSIVTDTTVIPLFYPRVRLEHTIGLSTYHYRFRDNYAGDSAYYSTFYPIKRLNSTSDTFFLRDHWKDITNDFSIYTFPDAKNAQQFLKLGAAFQLLQGTFDSGYVTTNNTSSNYHNFFVHGEYRNRTRNQKWDVEAHGNFYVNGLNTGDYNAYISLRRLISRQIGYLQVGFQNTNRTPSFVFDPISSFYLDTVPVSLKKENTTVLFGSFEQPKLRLKLSGSYYLVTNYAYFTNYYQAGQATNLFNVLQISAEKIFKIGGGWNWKTWVVLQQRIGDGPVNLPLISTRNQVGYDGTLGFKNLRISFGLEGRYFTSYKAPQYSPLTGQYFYQNDSTVSLKLPDISAFLHFRIKSFSAYVRAENLNTVNPSQGGFTKNNVPTINSPYPGLQVRVGIFWSFVN